MYFLWIVVLSLFCFNCSVEPDSNAPINQLAQQFAEHIEFDSPKGLVVASNKQASVLLDQFLFNNQIDSVGIIAEPIFSRDNSAIGRYFLFSKSELRFSALGIWENNQLIRLRLRPITL